MTREEKAAKTLMLFNINDIGEGELNTWYSGIDKDMQEALNIAIEVLQEQSTYCEECREATNDMLRKMQEKIKELKDTKESDLINRQDAIDAIEFGITYAKAINKETGEVIALFGKSNAELKEATNRIKSLPSAEPKTGKWIEGYADELHLLATYTCSECGNQELSEFKFCPNCGARMYKGGENE